MESLLHKEAWLGQRQSLVRAAIKNRLPYRTIMHLNGDKRSASGATDPKRLTPSNEEVFDLPRRFAIQHLFSRSRRSARQARLRHYILFPPLSHPPPARNLPLATSIHSTKQPSYSPTSTSQLTDAPRPSKNNTLPLLPSPRLHLLHSKLSSIASSSR